MHINSDQAQQFYFVWFELTCISLYLNYQNRSFWQCQHKLLEYILSLKHKNCILLKSTDVEEAVATSKQWIRISSDLDIEYPSDSKIHILPIHCQVRLPLILYFYYVHCTLQMFAGNYRDSTGKSECRLGISNLWGLHVHCKYIHFFLHWKGNEMQLKVHSLIVNSAIFSSSF